ncbi:hypothetical protein J2D73_13565 [Acetobacter sacchari]|uniref:HPr kinase/phosphorylase C-terminal domain-containing protein n=1 Tax=Acetobacter sacchari TaxID=2661687 RepID=A0ABS3LY36_9PROT|nr:hypothetical protein [Acetobacter sacchari]
MVMLTPGGQAAAPPASRSLHACCAARNGAGVLIFGPSGAGKSDLLLRLVHAGYDLVADDRVLLADGVACAPAPLRGMVEVRGWGLVRMPFVERVRAYLAVALIASGGEETAMASERSPEPETHEPSGLPLLRLNGFHASAVARIDVALDCVAPAPLRGRIGVMSLGDI